MKYPLVSIVIATYNRAQNIGEAIKSVQAQDYPHKEIIIVNDGSTDDTLTILAQYSNLTVITNKENLRLQKSLNIGCRAAKGKYIARLDDHDIWTEKEKLSKQISFLENNPDYGLIGTAFQIGKRIIINPQTDQLIRKQMLFRCPFCHYTVVFRKYWYDKVGGYNEQLPYSEDWDLWMKMGKVTKMANLSVITTCGAEEKGSLTDRFYTKQFSVNQKILKQYCKNYPNWYLAKIYHWGVGIFFKLFRKDSWIHRVMTRFYTWCFCRK